MCDKNINEILNLVFSSVNDEFNWVNNTTNAIDTVGGQLVLRPQGATSEFRRSIGAVDPSNNKIRLQANMDITRPQGSNDNTMCVVFGVFVGTQLIDEFSIYLDDVSAGSTTEYNLDRVYDLNNIAGVASLRITVPEGFGNEILLDYLKVEDFNFCSDDQRSYFVIDGFLEDSKNSTSSAIQLHEWRVDGLETLTADFFADNSNPGGVPSSDWKMSKANIDGSERESENTDPNSFNPFSSEWGLVFENVAGNFHGGKPTGTIGGNDYGSDILQIGFEKPAILNRDLDRKEGAFFIDIDFTKDLRITFDVIINNSSADPFNNPDVYRQYEIIFNKTKCECLFQYVDLLNPQAGIVNVFVDGFLSGLTGVEVNENVIDCDDSFSFSGQSGTFEFDIEFGTDIGQAGINYNAFGVPDRFELEWNGQIITSGYVGNQNSDQQLLNLGIPPSEINTATPSNGAGSLMFTKNQAFPTTATVRVTAPLSGTGWNVDGVCVDTGVGSGGLLVEVAEGLCGDNPRSWEDVYIDEPSLTGYIPANGDIIYLNQALTTPFNGGGNTYRMRVSNPPFQLVYDLQFDISSGGVISNVTQCSNGPGGSGPIDVVGSSDSSCASCWTVRVEVPQGETRTVNFLSNFGNSGQYGVGWCTPNQGQLVIGNDVQLNITQTTEFVFGIDGASSNSGNTESSTIIMTVLDGATQLDQQSFNRQHNPINC